MRRAFIISLLFPILAALLLVGRLAGAQEIRAGGLLYQAGSWTPALTFNSAAVGLACSPCAGFYTRIGNRVTFDFVIALSAKGSSTGPATVGGLPFTSENSAIQGGATCQFYSALAAATAISGYVATNGTVIALQIPGAAATAAAADTAFTNTSVLRCTGSYQAP